MISSTSSSRIRLFLRRALLFLVLLVASFWVLDKAFTWSFRRGNAYKPEWLNHIRNQRFDYAVLGNSRAYCDVDIAAVNRETGLCGLNLSLDGSKFFSNLLLLKMFLANGNRADVLLLQVDYANLSHDTLCGFSSYTFFPFLTEPYVFDQFREYGFKWYLYRYVPFARYAHFNFKWGGDQLLCSLFRLRKPPFDQYGSLLLDGQMPEPAGPPMAPGTITLNGRNRYLYEIIQLCRERRINLVLFTSPYLVELASNKNEFIRCVQGYGVPYVFFGDHYRNQRALFKDELHLNAEGASLFAKDLATVISGKGALLREQGDTSQSPATRRLAAGK